MNSQMPWLKFWPTNFMMDTQHLSFAQKGVHIDLICHAWRRLNIALPNDDDWIRRRLGVDDEQYRREVLPVLEEFWPVEGDDRVNQTLRDEYADALARAEKSRRAANIRHHGSNVLALKQKGNL